MGSLAIPSGATVYADTAVFIYTIEEHPDYYHLLRSLWIQFQASQLEIVSSELTLLETLIVPTRNLDIELIQAYEQLLLASPIQLLPITRLILKTATQLRAKTNLKTPDAIHVATALSAGCDLFLTNDTQLRTITDVKIVILSELLKN